MGHSSALIQLHRTDVEQTCLCHTQRESNDVHHCLWSGNQLWCLHVCVYAKPTVFWCWVTSQTNEFFQGPTRSQDVSHHYLSFSSVEVDCSSRLSFSSSCGVLHSFFVPMTLISSCVSSQSTWTNTLHLSCSLKTPRKPQRCFSCEGRFIAWMLTEP